MSRVLHIGAARPPNAYVLDLTPEASSGIDLSTVTAATFVVRKPDGTETTWTATRSNQTTTTLKLTHIFAIGEVTASGDWTIYPELTIPSGVVTADPQTMPVKGKFET